MLEKRPSAVWDLFKFASDEGHRTVVALFFITFVIFGIERVLVPFFYHLHVAPLEMTDCVGCFNTGKAQKLLNVSNLKNWSPKHKERMKECQQQQQQQNSTAAPKPYRFIILHSSGSSGMLGWWRSVNQFIHLRRIKCTDSSDSNTILFSNWDSHLGGRVPRRSNSLTLKI